MAHVLIVPGFIVCREYRIYLTYLGIDESAASRPHKRLQLLGHRIYPLRLIDVVSQYRIGLLVMIAIEIFRVLGASLREKLLLLDAIDRAHQIGWLLGMKVTRRVGALVYFWEHVFSFLHLMCK